MNSLINSILFLRFYILYKIGRIGEINKTHRYDMDFIHGCDFFDRFRSKKDWMALTQYEYGGRPEGMLDCASINGFLVYQDSAHLFARRIKEPKENQRPFTGVEAYNRRRLPVRGAHGLSVSYVPKKGHIWWLSLTSILSESDHDFAFRLIRVGDNPEKRHGFAISVAHRSTSPLKWVFTRLFNKVFSGANKTPKKQEYFMEYYSDKIFKKDIFDRLELSLMCKITKNYIRVYLKDKLIFVYWVRVPDIEINYHVAHHVTDHGGRIDQKSIPADVQSATVSFNELWYKKQ